MFAGIGWLKHFAEWGGRQWSMKYLLVV